MNILISGASTGIGRASAVHMARLGHQVWAGVRSTRSAEEIVKLNVQGLRPVPLDVCDESSIVEGLRQVRKDGGMLHGLVNNAGVAIGGPVEAVRLEDWRAQFDANVFGVVRVTQEAMPLLRESKGRIVNMSSISGRLASPFLGPYAASKFALEGLSDSLRREVARQGVKVALVEPGPIATPIWEKSRAAGLARAAKYSPEMMDVYGPWLERFERGLERNVRVASPVAVVVKAVEHALLARRPKTRYPVGRGISLAAVLASALPDRFLDRMLRFGV